MGKTRVKFIGNGNTETCLAPGVIGMSINVTASQRRAKSWRFGGRTT